MVKRLIGEGVGGVADAGHRRVISLNNNYSFGKNLVIENESSFFKIVIFI